MFKRNKILATFLCVSLSLGGFPIKTNAASITTTPAQTRAANQYVSNTMSEGIRVLEEPESTVSDEPVISFDEAVNQCRKYLVNREVGFSLRLDKEYDHTVVKQLIDAATAVTDSTKPNEGDYIRASMTNYTYTLENIKTDPVTTVIKFNMNYYTSAQLERQVDKAVKEILNKLDVYQADSYTKIKAVYQWLTSNVRYDQTYTMYSCYDALIRKSAVCLGYASAMYRLLKELDVDVRTITGMCSNMGHAWNIAKIGEYWYNLDATLDAGTENALPMDRYFLQNQEDFWNHTRDFAYNTEEFHKQYPITPVSYSIENEIKISSDVLNLKSGESRLLKALNKETGEAVTNVIWSSDNVKAVTVDKSGNVKAIGKGSAVITARTKDGLYGASCKVNVSVPVTSVKMSKTAVTLEKGKTYTLTATVSPADANNKTVTYASSNAKVAKVNATTGVVTAVANGTAVIKVKTKDGAKTAQCKVTVKTSVKSVSLSIKSVKLKKGKTVKMKATVAPTTATNKKVTFKSSNKKIATVTSAGVVKGIKKGTAVITVTTVDGKKTAKCKVTVY